MCDARRVKSVVVDLGDGDDIFADDGSIAVQLSCGSGDDCAALSPVVPDSVDVPEPPTDPSVPADDPTVPPSVLAAGPPVTISSAPVAIDAHGRVPVAVSCPAS